VRLKPDPEFTFTSTPLSELKTVNCSKADLKTKDGRLEPYIDPKRKTQNSKLYTVNPEP